MESTGPIILLKRVPRALAPVRPLPFTPLPLFTCPSCVLQLLTILFYQLFPITLPLPIFLRPWDFVLNLFCKIKNSIKKRP